MTVSHKASIDGYPEDVWFSKRAITNIISLKNLRNVYLVTYNSEDGRGFVVHREAHGKPNMMFKEHPSGLHYFDPFDNDFLFVNTVEENKIGFTRRQIKEAELAKSLRAMLAYPSEKDFRWVIQSNQIKNCPVTVQAVDNATKIWGKDIATLKGKTTRTKPSPVASEDFIKVPKEILDLHRDVFLTADIFFVNGIPFLLTLSRKLQFTAVNHLPNRKVSEVFKAFKEIYGYYRKRGFRITVVHVDNEFEPLAELIEAMPGGPKVNVASSNEHVPEIERRIRVVKERCRATRHGLPFSRLPVLLVIYIVFTCVKQLNLFPTKGSILDNISPKTLLSGEALDYKKHLRLQLGQYCQVHEENEPRNSQLPRTKGAICLGPTGNLQGGYFFMSLSSGKKIKRYSWDEIPMPDTVIDRVNELGKGQPEQLVFTDRKGRLIGDVDLTGVSTGNNQAPQQQNDPEIEVNDNDLDIIPGEEEAAPVEEPEVQPAAVPEVDEQQQVQQQPQVEVETVEEEAVDDNHGPVPAPEPAQAQDELPGVRRSSRVRFKPAGYTPSMTGKRYAYAATQLESDFKWNTLHPNAHMSFAQYDDMYQAEPDVVAAIMTQLSLKAGLKKWGGKAREAVHSEMKQLHLRKTFKPMRWSELKEDQRKSVLESHLFLKLKRDGKIKGRTVAGGNKQRDFISKEDASSPTVATESVLLTCIVDAEEGRDVAVVDIPNAFIQTRIEDENDMAIIRIRGVLVDVLVDIAPDVYKPYVTTDRKGEKQLIVQCQNAIYGTMTASLLYYRKFRKSLEDIGFEFNPYDPCVANKMVNGKQFTICFHVDDAKLSHFDPKEVDKMIAWLKQEYESIFEDGSGKMTVSRGKVHKYLGMTLDYTTPGQVKITMFGHM
jgi:hypothetical protein